MPPKKGAKKTKKQIEDEKREAEEERIKQEELDAKLRAEEEERRRKEEARLKAEEEKRQEEEQKRLTEENPEVEERKASMKENAGVAEKARIKDLPDKFLACNHLPDPYNERDLTSFMTLWSERPDKTLTDAIDNCQTAETVNSVMQDISGEAMANGNEPKLAECNYYTQELRKIELQKYDEITAHIFEYMEQHSKRTAEEIAKVRADLSKSRGNKGDLSQKDFVEMLLHRKDLIFGIWANVQSKNMSHEGVSFKLNPGTPGEKQICKTSLPQKYASMQIVVRCLWTSYDYLSFTKKSTDIVVGGIMDFRMYSYPEIAKTQFKWCMRRVLSTEERLKVIPFPDTSMTMVDNPVEITIKVPDYLYMSQDSTMIKIGVWDEKENEWNTDYIVGDTAYDSEERTVTFQSQKFAPIAMLQSRCTDYPYRHWEFRCTDDQTALLSLETKRGLNLNFEISALCVRLIENDCVELQHLVNQDFTPGYLLQELKKCGINLMPHQDDFTLGGIIEKDWDAEYRAIVDVACSVRAFYYKKAKWNQGPPEKEGIPGQQIVLRVRENPEQDRKFEEDLETDWRYLSWWSNKVSFVEGTKDTDEHCKPRFADGQLTHSLLTQAINPPICSEAAFIKSQQFTEDVIDFINTIKKTLSLLRLFAFA